MNSLTAELIKQAEAHLSGVCPVMAELIDKHSPCTLAGREFSPFATLVTSIIGQQLSMKVADTIERRVLALVTGEFTPQAVAALVPEKLRQAGLSSAKVRYILELAKRASDGRLDLNALPQMDDETVITTLVELPGIGRWTAEMFLIFSLARPDVLSPGDAGLQRAVRQLFGEDATLQQVGPRWRPFCSVACWYLWRSLDG